MKLQGILYNQIALHQLPQSNFVTISEMLYISTVNAYKYLSVTVVCKKVLQVQSFI